MRKVEICTYGIIAFLFTSIALLISSCSKAPIIKDDADLMKYLSGKCIQVIRDEQLKEYDLGLYPFEGAVKELKGDSTSSKIRFYFKDTECGLQYQNYIGIPTVYRIEKVQNIGDNKINDDTYYFRLHINVNDNDSVLVSIDMYGQCLFAESKIFDISVNDAFIRYNNNAFPNTPATPFDNYSKEQRWLNYRKVTRVNIKYDNAPSSFDWNVKDPRMIPERIEYDGYPGAEYRIDGNIIALDEYIETDPSGFYLRMQFKGEKVVLNHLQSESDSLTDVFSNESYKVRFVTEKYGECAGEGKQEIFGKVTIKYNNKLNVLDFQSSTIYCQDPRCKEIGNGL
jgi:hypothetical protein